MLPQHTKAIRIPTTNENVQARCAAVTQCTTLLEKFHISNPEKFITENLRALDPGFHGLSAEEIEAIVGEVADTFTRRFEPQEERSSLQWSLSPVQMNVWDDDSPPRVKPSCSLVKKDRYVPRTIRYDFDKRVAFVFLKSKEKLQGADGAYWRGRNALRIDWVTKTVQQCFQLVPHDDKADSLTVTQKPFDERLSKEEYRAIEPIFLERYELFTYTKIKKGTGQRIVKQCKVYPYIPSRLSKLQDRIEQLAGLSDVARDLRLLHSNGHVHWDLKDHNILTDGIQTKIIDFDRAFSFYKGEAPWRKGRYGTGCFSAPEILNDTIDPKGGYPPADMYAFGHLVYALAHRKYPQMVQSLNFYFEHRGEHLLEQIIKMQKAYAKDAADAWLQIKKVTEIDKFLQLAALILLDPDPATRCTAAQFCQLVEDFWQRQDLADLLLN